LPIILNSREDFNAHCFIDNDGLHYAKYDNLLITSVYQPIMSPDLKPFAFEALARFKSEETGEAISPDSLFNSDQVSIAKKINIDRLSRAIHVRNLAKSNVTHLKLFLNVLPVSGEYNAFMAIKASLLENRIIELGMKTEQVVMEIVESAAFDNQLLVDATVAMQQSGFQVAMDDFGEQSDLLDIVRVSKFIGSKTVIEGVEEPEQYNAMKALGLDFYQGYLFAKPAPLPCAVRVR
jgi:EAL domain-containing protein (putative c-di-GMP-specific phosphodiesterase class I)